jgi:hypothetical protein
MWKSGVVGRISKRAGNGGKVVLVLGLFPGFQGAAFPQRFTGGARKR